MFVFYEASSLFDGLNTTLIFERTATENPLEIKALIFSWISVSNHTARKSAICWTCIDYWRACARSRTVDITDLEFDRANYLFCYFVR